jgi:hypothetical protein
MNNREMNYRELFPRNHSVLICKLGSPGPIELLNLLIVIRYGSNPTMFISKQTTFIQSNTTRGLF